VGVHLRVSGQSINAFLNPSSVADGKDERQMQGYYEKPGDAQLGYTFPAFQLEYAMRNTHVPVGPWRGVNTNQNAVYMECFVDEIAHAAGTDPLEFRRALMSKHPKHLAVLNAAAEKAEWGKPCRRASTVASRSSWVMPAIRRRWRKSVSDQGKLKVHRRCSRSIAGTR
jgi:isoquinoline 1-oxidoreductase beta subunit